MCGALCTVALERIRLFAGRAYTAGVCRQILKIWLEARLTLLSCRHYNTVEGRALFRV